MNPIIYMEGGYLIHVWTDQQNNKFRYLSLCSSKKQAYQVHLPNLGMYCCLKGHPCIYIKNYIANVTNGGDHAPCVWTFEADVTFFSEWLLLHYVPQHRFAFDASQHLSEPYPSKSWNYTWWVWWQIVLFRHPTGTDQEKQCTHSLNRRLSQGFNAKWKKKFIRYMCSCG